jgi:hypothetical protein
MKHFRLAILAFLALIISNSGFGQSLSEFEATLKECGMTLNIPSTFVESKVVANKNMDYDYAVKYPDKNFELRYAVRPIKYRVYPNDSVKKAVESKIIFRNTTYEESLKSIIFSITGGYQYEFKAFEKSAAQDEFNADWGSITMVEVRSEFGKGWRFCMIVALHKDNVADAYYFYMSNAQDIFPASMKPLFHSLRFD